MRTRLFYGVIFCILTNCTGEFTTIDRHNIGVVLTKKGEVQVSTAMARLIFHLLSPIPRKEVDCYNIGRYRSHNHTVCRSIRPLMLEYQAMKKRMLYHLRVHMRRIYGVLTDFPVKFQSISKRSGWSNFMSHITGLAEKGDVDHVITMLRRLERGVLKAAEVWKTVTFLQHLRLKRYGLIISYT